MDYVLKHALYPNKNLTFQNYQPKLKEPRRGYRVPVLLTQIL